MAHLTPNLPTGQSDEGFDLSQIFIGRQQQLDLFEIYLHRWKQLIFSDTSDQSPITAPPSPSNKIQGLVVLLFGRGGFGKSTLLKHYRNLAPQEGGNPLTSNIVDWEFAIEGKRGLFNPPPGQQLDAAEYFKVLCGELAIALGKDPREFRAYQAAVKDVERAKKEASNVLDSMQKDDRYGWLRGLTVEIITSAVTTYVPGSKAVVESKAVQDTAKEVAKLTQEQIAQVYARLRNKLGNKLGDYLEPSLRLGLALGSDLRDMARNYPLLIFFDTYEEADEGDRLLRMVMGAAGIRVGWVIAGRDNLWAGPEQRERSVDVEYGYKEIVPIDRGLSINFNAGDIGAFTLSDIIEYFALWRKKIPYQPPLPELAEEQAKRILDVTQGVPLAIKIAAGLYVETENIDKVTEPVEGKREIVDQMVHRYLLHTHTNMEERARLYGLALLRRADRPTAIAAALGLTREQAMTSYSSELSRLHRRYSFVFTEKEEPALHAEVRHFLRLWLQEHRKEPEITSINQRLKQLHETALKDLEEQLLYRTLKERLQDDEWVGIYLDLTEQQYWLDPVEGVRTILPFMIAASIYRRDINADASTIGQFFEQQVRRPYLDWWIWASQSLVYTTSRDPLPEELTGLEELAKLAKERCPTFPLLLPDCRKELEAALWWRLGESHRGRDENKAVKRFEQALSRLDKEIELREVAAEACYEVGRGLVQERKYTESIRFLYRAIELMSDFTWAYIVRGNAFGNLKEYQRALQDFNRALELDSTYALAYINRGNIYEALKDYERALQDYERAIELDPADATAYNNRGNIYEALKDYERALQDFNRALELDPANTAAYNNRGLVYGDLKDYERALQDFNRAIELDPANTVVYKNRGLVYGALKDYERALQDYERALELDPADAAAYNNRGNAFGNLKEYQRALQDYERAIELDPTNAAIYNNRGNAYSVLKDYERALQDFNRALELDPTNATVYYCRGNAFWNLKDYERALQDYERAIELDPTNAEVYKNRGLVYGALKDYERALQNYERAIELDPADATAYNNRGLVYRALKDYERALQDYERAIELDPTNAAIYFNRGLVYGDLKDYERALQDFNRALELDAANTVVYKNRGLVYRALKDYERALQDYERAIELDPADAEVYKNRGLVYGDLKGYERALQDFNRAIELDPADSAAYFRRGNAFWNLKEYQRALQDYERAIELDPADSAAYFNCGHAYLWLKNVPQARINYAQSFELDSTDVNAAWMAEWVGMGKRRPGLEEAMRLEAIADIEPGHYLAYVCRGVALGLEGKVKEGLQEVEKAIPLDPQEWDAYFWKGMLLAYYYRRLPHADEVMTMIEQSLTVGLPSQLLTPLYWLEKDLPDLFVKYVRPLLLHYDV